MNWYYSEGDEVVGPLAEATMVELRACGMLKDDTQVCQEGTETWRRYDDSLMKVDPAQTPGGSDMAGAMIKFQCPHCGVKISTGLDDAGVAVNCPSCKVDLVIPSATPEAVTLPPHSESGVTQSEASYTPPDESGGTEDSISPGGTPGPTIGARLSTFAKAAAHEAKLSSKIALLKGRIENARQIELRKAHYALGRKLYESRTLLSMQDEIESLERHIAESGERVTVEEHETKGAMLKRMGKNAAKSAESELLSLKLKQALTHLGALARNLPEHAAGTESEMAAISAVESKIRQFEEEVSSLEALSHTRVQRKGKSGMLKRPLVVGILGLAILAGVAYGFSRFSGSKSGSGSKSIVIDSQEPSKEIKNGSETIFSESPSMGEESKASSHYSNKGSIVVRGFYIGMSEKSAIQKLKDIFGDDLKLIKQKKLYRGHLEVFQFSSPHLKPLLGYNLEVPDCLIDIDATTRTLGAFSICGAHFNRLFGVEDLKFHEFAQQFMRQFSIRELQPSPSESNDQIQVYSFIDQQTNIRLSKRVANDAFMYFSMDLIEKANF